MYYLGKIFFSRDPVDKMLIKSMRYLRAKKKLEAETTNVTMKAIAREIKRSVRTAHRYKKWSETLFPLWQKKMYERDAQFFKQYPWMRSENYNPVYDEDCVFKIIEEFLEKKECSISFTRRLLRDENH